MKRLSFLLLTILAMVAIAGIPLITIWSLNTLFSLGISYTVQSWLATVWLSITTFGGLTNAVNNLKK